MKLRNKKTGGVFDVTFYSSYKGGKITIGVEVDADPKYPKCTFSDYESLKEFCENWEDYTPAEPLIKDEKIRKAVRTWADASGIEKVLSYGGTFWLGFRSLSAESVWKFECNYVDASDFEDKEFSITELCGEEEE